MKFSVFNLMFLWYVRDVFLNTLTRENVNTFRGQHIVGLLFFKLSNDCISFCKQLVKDISVHHVNCCLFNTFCSAQRVDAAQWRTELYRYRLPYSLSWAWCHWETWDYFFCLFQGFIHHHIRGLKYCSGLCSRTISGICNLEAYAYNISVNWVLKLLDSE